MKIENQVCSLELAKKLKKAGYNQEGVWWWVWDKKPYNQTECEYTISRNKIATFLNHSEIKEQNKESYVAPTVAELGERMPMRNYTTVKNTYSEWIALESAKPNSLEFFDEIALADTEADARAKCLLYLVENGIISF